MYAPPLFLFNAHLETVWPSLFRKVHLKDYQRERIATLDNDFLDLDWLTIGTGKIVIISHGLEGNSARAYVKGMAKAFFEQGFDVLAWNYRGCSEEMNKTLRFYHSGATDDLSIVIDHVISKGYEKVFLVGFSLGGNLTLKYAGERATNSKIKGVVVFSVPLNLHTSCIKISQPSNWIYAQRFVRSLKKKVKAKAAVINELNVEGIDKIKDLTTFDDRFTAPLHGFKNAIEYYRQCSSIGFLKGITIPTLIVNARNDPFLSEDCFPRETENEYVALEFPSRGGHVGFAAFDGNGLYWSEQRALDFILPLTS